MDILTGRSTIIRLHTLAPSITEANIVISAYLSRVPKLEAMIANQNTKNIIQDIFGISESLFEAILISASEVGTMEEGLPNEATNDLPSLIGTTYIIANNGEILIEALTPPDWTDDDILYIDHQDVEPLVHAGAFRHRGIRDIHPAVLNYIISGITECGQDFLGDSGYPSYFKLISYYLEDLIEITNHLIMICIGPFKELLDKASITQRDFASYCNISWRTVEDWCTGRSNCKIYLRLLIAEQIGLMQRRKPCLKKYKEKQEDQFNQSNQPENKKEKVIKTDKFNRQPYFCMLCFMMILAAGVLTSGSGNLIYGIEMIAIGGLIKCMHDMDNSWAEAKRTVKAFTIGSPILGIIMIIITLCFPIIKI